MAIRVFLADDHGVLRDGLHFLLDAYPDLIVVGEAGNGRQAVQRITGLSPDVAVMDIAMPELNGIEATRQVREACPTTQVVILSMHSMVEHIARAFQAGALGYVLKESIGLELVNAIQTVHRGQRYLSPKLTEASLETYPSAQTQNPLERLSAREREVLQMVVEGKSSAEIAAILSLSPKTVETYRVRLMRKLNLHDLPSLIRFAIQQSLTSLE
jgi:DNA-binding NarL/FixJ family response regulator